MRSVRFCLAALALVFFAACGGSSSTPTTPSNSGGGGGGSNGTPVTIAKGAEFLTTTAYAPNPLTITAGTTVTWTNSDSIQHTVTSDSNAFGSGLINGGGNFSTTFQNKGTFTYHCSVHPNMIGTVIVQ